MSKHRIIGPGGQEMQKDMWHIEDFYPSDLELKTRKEVMDAVDRLIVLQNMEDGLFTSENDELLHSIKDRLNLLWGE